MSLDDAVVEPVGTHPPLFVVQGEATDEEVAALAVVLQSLAASAAASRADDRRTTSQWSAHHRKLRRPLTGGPGAWRASGLPQ